MKIGFVKFFYIFLILANWQLLLKIFVEWDIEFEEIWRVKIEIGKTKKIINN